MIAFRSVHKRYGDDAVAVRDLSFEIASGEMCMLVGPSGCGKTTTLKMINRLIEPTSGEIVIDGENVLTVDPVELRRHIGYVMQQGGLFPHLRIGDNVATVPRLLGWSKAKVASRVDELLTLVGLDPSRYADRYPHELSGGERQRVGVARALGGDPPLLLMDEPFGAVDPIARRRLQEEFLALQARLEKTVVFVTHDIDEALHLGTKVAIMRQGGELVQYDTPEALVHRPATSFVAQFIGVRGELDELGRVLLEARDLELVPTVPAVAARSGAPVASPSPFGVAAVVDDGSVTGYMAVRTTDDGSSTLDGAVVPIGTTVALGDPLDEVLARILGHDGGFVGVTDGDRFVGVATLTRLHAAVRRTATD